MPRKDKKKNPPGYDIWYKMRDRCYNPKANRYKDYGGRGITVCPEWLTEGHERFLKDMGYRPSGTTIERLNNDLGYTSDNCVWGTKRQQSRNRRNVRHVIIEGNKYLAVELADKCKLDPDVIVARAARGLILTKVLSKSKQANPINQQIATRAAITAKLAKTHCKHGHEWTHENTRINKNGRRGCRACGREHQRKLRERYAPCGM
jgi:hypothetical protein